MIGSAGMGFTDQQLRDTFPVQAGIDGADLMPAVH